METLKKVIRVITLVFLIILAASGIFAIFLPPNREKYVDKEVTTEQVDKKKGENQTREVRE
jgi:hypothetical protein